MKKVSFFLFIFWSFYLNAQIENDSVLKLNYPVISNNSIGYFNGTNRNSSTLLQWNNFKGSLYFDGYFNLNAARPKDNTQSTSATLGRCNEFDISLISLGGKFQEGNTWGIVYFQAGNMTNVVHELDPSVKKGWNSGASELEFIREAYAGCFLSKNKKWSTEFGIFNSYIGAESYLVQENWNYQRSLISDLTPFYFQGAKLQYYPNKIRSHEIWLMNGWQSYHRIGNAFGIGSINNWNVEDRFKLTANGYIGTDSRTQSGASSNVLRFHHDHAIQYLWKNHGISINNHFGWQQGDVNAGISKGKFVGTAIAHRHFYKKFAITERLDGMENPGLYLAWNPVPLFPTNFYLNNKNIKVIQATVTYDRFLSDHLMFRMELLARRADRPYFVSKDGTTSTNGWIDYPITSNWYPHLNRNELRLMFAINFRL